MTGETMIEEMTGEEIEGMTGEAEEAETDAVAEAVIEVEVEEDKFKKLRAMCYGP